MSWYILDKTSTTVTDKRGDSISNNNFFIFELNLLRYLRTK